MPVSVACSSCGTKLRAPDAAIGRTFKCPKCGNSVQVATSTDRSVAPIPEVKHDPPIVKPIPVAVVYTPPTHVVEPAPLAQVIPEEPKKACPFCGENVIAVAKKCKHCGETIDVALRAAEEAKRAADAARLAAERAASRQHTPMVFMNAGGAASSSSSSAAAAATTRSRRSSPFSTCLTCGCLTILASLALVVGLTVTGLGVGVLSQQSSQKNPTTTKSTEKTKPVPHTP